MEKHLELIRLLAFLGGFSILFTLESLFPRRPWKETRKKRLLFHSALATFNALTIRLVISSPFLLWTHTVRDNGWGLMGWLDWGAMTEVCASLVALDFLNYVWHRLNHTLPFLWRFHKVHHVDTHLDVTTSLRFHLGELFLSAGAKTIWVLLIGPSIWGFAIFEAAISLATQFHHSNIDFPDRVESGLRSIIVTPRFHAAHHTVTPRTREGNYSTILICWDKIFGSFQLPDEKELQHLGLPRGRDTYLSIVPTLMGPIRGEY